MLTCFFVEIQKTFDRELSEHRLNASGWFSNASSDAILGYKLMVQTGNRDKSYDKERVSMDNSIQIDTYTGFLGQKIFIIYSCFRHKQAVVKS
jgi:hypothetical protein